MNTDFFVHSHSTGEWGRLEDILRMDQVVENLESILQSWWESFLNNLPAIVAGVLIFFLSIYLGRWLVKVVKRVLNRRDTDPELTLLIGRLTRWTVIGLGFVLALQQSGVNVTAILTGLGIVGFTVGFALQDISSNFMAGILLLFQQPFDLGDTIKVQGYTGTVLDIDLRATEMLTIDGLRVMIPNNDIFTSTITNYTRTAQRRITLKVGIGYDNDLSEVERITLEALKKLDTVLTDPAPVVMFDEFGEFAVNMSVYFWYSTEKVGYGEISNNGVYVVKDVLEQAGVSIPIPNQIVRIVQSGQ
jgi:small-conductance mechanosensitive channel